MDSFFISKNLQGAICTFAGFEYTEIIYIPLWGCEYFQRRYYAKLGPYCTSCRKGRFRFFTHLGCNRNLIGVTCSMPAKHCGTLLLSKHWRKLIVGCFPFLLPLYPPENLLQMFSSPKVPSNSSHIVEYTATLQRHLAGCSYSWQSFRKHGSIYSG